MEGAVRKVKVPTSLTLEKSGSPRKTISQSLRITLRLGTRASFSPGIAESWQKHVEYSVALRRRNRRFPCSLRMRIWRWFKRAIRLPGIVTHLARNHTPEKVCGTLPWRGLKWDRTKLPRWDEGSMAESALRPIGWWVACSLLYPGGKIICRYEQFCMPTASDREAKFANRKGSPHLLNFKVWEVTKVDCSLSLPFPLCHERHKHTKEGAKRWKERRSCPFMSFTDPTQKAGIENWPEMRVRSYSKFKLPVTVLGWRYNQLTSLFSFPFLLPPSDLGFWIATRSHD